jgi:hypothetical protein
MIVCPLCGGDAAEQSLQGAVVHVVIYCLACGYVSSFRLPPSDPALVELLPNALKPFIREAVIPLRMDKPSVAAGKLLSWWPEGRSVRSSDGIFVSVDPLEVGGRLKWRRRDYSDESCNHQLNGDSYADYSTYGGALFPSAAEHAAVAFVQRNSPEFRLLTRRR